MAFILVGLLLLGIVYGPHLWCRWVISRHGADRPDLPGTGGELARHLLDGFGLSEVAVEVTDQGDHYDPEDKIVRLSPAHHDGRSIAAVAIAAHEVGHAIQHRDGYAPLKRRQDLVYVTKDVVRVGAVILMAAPVIGLIALSPAAFAAVVGIGILTLAIQVVIHLITLPVEFDASFGRALPVLENGGYLDRTDMPAARQLLRAAALTYVAGSLSSLFNLWRWIRVIF